MKKPTKPNAATAGKPAERGVAKRPSSAVAKSAPVAGRGLENIDRKDVLLPRINLLQQMSPEVTGDLKQKAGTMYIKLANKSLGTKVIITPIMHFRSRIKWVPQDDGGGIECSSPDGKKPLSDLIAPTCGDCTCKEWDDTKKGKDQAPACTLYENFLVLIGDSKEPVLLPMERTKAKVAKKFFSMAALKNCDLWNWQYELSTKQDKNDKDQAYYNYVVTDLSKATSEERKAICEQFWNALHTKTIITDHENPDTETGTSGGQPGSDKF